MLRGTRRYSAISFRILGLIPSVSGDLSIFSWRRHFLTSSFTSTVVSASVVWFFGVTCRMLAVASFVNVLVDLGYLPLRCRFW